MIDTRIHSKSLIIKSLLGRLEFPLWRFTSLKSPNELYVLNYHSTPKKFISNFESQLRFYQKHFKIISPAEAHDYLDAKEINASTKPRILLTFDDGLKNNLNALASMNKLGIKALFFVVPDFVNAKDQRSFYQQNIRPLTNPNIDALDEDFTPMTWSDLHLLIDTGHSIGSHSMTHVMSSSDKNVERLILEITSSKNLLEKQLNSNISAFCAPNNSLQSVNLSALKLIQENYQYFYSTFPGSNESEKDNWFIKRSNVECFWPLGSVMYALGNQERKRWKEARELFKELRRKTING